MKKKAQSLGFGIMTAIFILVIGFTVLNFVKDEVTTARVNLNCSNAAAITDGTKLLCLVIDTTVPYWILIIFSLVVGLVTWRMKR